MENRFEVYQYKSYEMIDAMYKVQRDAAIRNNVTEYIASQECDDCLRMWDSMEMVVYPYLQRIFIFPDYEFNYEDFVR